ncbi:MAG TPA: hypothetical protein VKC60_15765 [Opitutaceae bacterium]|nr:hypothetical protein [Opitutaceae bacterium]
MSWDIFVQDIPRGLSRAEDLPDGFQSKPIGARSEIIQIIRAVVPTANFADPSWGTIDGPGYSIEVNLGNAEVLDSFAFHVHGGDMAAFVIADILERLDLRAFDTGSDTGLFSIGPDGSSGQKRWRAYRDQILGHA